MEALEQYIYNSIVKHHKKCSVDKYGQTKPFTISEVFPQEKRKEVEDFIRAGKASLVTLDCYGSQFGTYYGISILDKNLKHLCSKELRKNEEYRYAMTH